MSYPPPPFIPPGYSIERFLGSGKAANVYLAAHATFGRVALKLPHEATLKDALLTRFFANEVQMSEKLKHPRVINVIDSKAGGLQPFMAIEYCNNGSLQERLNAAMDLDTAFRFVLDVALGLNHAHTQMMLHRDVKPANVFLQGERAKLGDFGTASYFEAKTQEATNKDRVGTAFYMAPELFQGEVATVRSDIYSLGILAYEVVAGARPFQGENEGELMLAHTTALPMNLRQHRPEISSSVSRVIATAMARNAEKRFENSAEFIEAFCATTRLPQPSLDLPAAPIGSSLGRSSRPTPLPSAQTPKAAEKKGGFGWFKRKK